MHVIELDAMYASLLAEIDIFIKEKRAQHAEGVFAVMVRLVSLHGADGASLFHLFRKLEHIPGAYKHAKTIAHFASNTERGLIAVAEESSVALEKMRQTPTSSRPPLFD